MRRPVRLYRGSTYSLDREPATEERRILLTPDGLTVVTDPAPVVRARIGFDPTRIDR